MTRIGQYKLHIGHIIGQCVLFALSTASETISAPITFSRVLKDRDLLFRPAI